jgi:ribose transport system substrate-binding protein
MSVSSNVRSGVKRRTVHRLAMVVMALALTVGVAACGGDDDDSGSAGGGGGGEDPVSVGLFMLAATNGYVQGTLAGSEKAAAEDGNATVTGIDGKFDPKVQFQQVQDAVAANQYDVFVVMANDGRSLAPAVEAAGSQGIKSVAAYNTIGPDPTKSEPQVEGVVGTVWVPTSWFGEKLGELTVEACKKSGADPCQVSYMNGGLSIPFEKERLPFYEEPLNESTDPTIEVVDTPEGENLQSEAIPAAQDSLQANPDIDVFASISDQMMLGIERVLKTSGKDDVELVSVGATRSGVQAIRDHKWLATVPALPFTEGQIATEMAIATARGEEPDEPVVLLYEHSPVGEVFDWESADANPDFKGEWEG